MLAIPAPDTGEQDGSGIAESTLTSTRSGEVWISRSTGPNLLRWSNGRWTSPPALARAGVDELWVEAVAASPSGRIFIAAAANRADGARVLHIARLNRGAWEWLGAPLVSTPEPFTHAQRPSIAFLGEQPVVAWSEERDAQRAGLFVARWNGSSWTRLGALTLDRGENDSFLTPAVAVDVRQQIWLAWIGTVAVYGSHAGMAVPGVTSDANRWRRSLPFRARPPCVSSRCLSTRKAVPGFSGLRTSRLVPSSPSHGGTSTAGRLFLPRASLLEYRPEPGQFR